MMVKCDLIAFILFLINLNFVLLGRVRVKIYDHRAEHDPNSLYGTGPWKYKGYGYGIEYQYEPDGSYGREKGYGFMKAFGVDFCRHSKSSLCRKSSPLSMSSSSSSNEDEEDDKSFFKEMINPGEPYWGHPSGDVLRDNLSTLQSQSNKVVGSWKPNWIRHD
ncbi:uncharacterized protein LOC128387716 [Panonychus citri]|uniref:uncharacterized protein LOC128387716 n=1 Tax=Panonychus citri TaxID=50023 RepID=UPI002306FB29|nr:uncharacterized protein LOC128387716 [Panonychus citri]